MEKETTPKTHKATGEKLAVVRIRSASRANHAVLDTFRMFNLDRKFTCTIIEKSPVTMGMLNKVKDFSTFGEIDAETLKLLQEKRGEKDKEGKLKKFFRLAPPRGGFERKGLKVSYYGGGALGYRGPNMSKLIQRMI